MPPVILFNKQWRLGSDDFVFSAVFEILCRVGSTITIGFILGFHMQELNKLECMGKIFDNTVPHPRKHVSTHLYINCSLTFAECIITGCGTFFVIKDWIRCDKEESFRVVIIFILLIIALTYVLLIIKFICVITAFKPFSKRVTSSEKEPLAKYERIKKESVWAYRGLRCLMPWTNDESTLEAFKEISNMLAKTFHDDDMVPSDIAAGLLLLHFKHSRAKEEKTVKIQPILQRTVEVSTDINDLKYFYKYSLAAYGCWWYIVENPIARCCSLTGYLHYCPCFPCMRSQSKIVEGDGCCNINLAAAKALLDSTDEDFIIFDNRNKIQEVPYFVAVDHEKKCLVISIRGTMSIADMFTDLRAESCALNTGFPEDIVLNGKLQGHKGMVHAARYVYLRLHGLPVSEAEKKKDRQERVNHLNLALAEFPDYSIVVTGHSLGAGTASILSFILREKYKNRVVKCFAYSPPGGLLSPTAAEESLKFTVTLVTGDDVIPRLSLSNIAKLSEEIRKVAEECRIPKYKLFGHGLVSFLCCVKSTTIHEELRRMSMERLNSSHEEENINTGKQNVNKTTVSELENPSERDLIVLSPPGISRNKESLLIDVEEVEQEEDQDHHSNGDTLKQQVASECEKLKKSAEEFNKIEEVVSSKEEEILSMVQVNTTDTEVSNETVIVQRSTATECKSSGGSGQQLLITSATEQILSLRLEGETMYPPGRIIYLEETEDGDCQVFRPDKTHFKNILVSPRNNVSDKKKEKNVQSLRKKKSASEIFKKSGNAMNRTHNSHLTAPPSPSSSSELEDTDEMADLEPVCKKAKMREDNNSHRCGESCDQAEECSGGNSSTNTRCQQHQQHQGSQQQQETQESIRCSSNSMQALHNSNISSIGTTPVTAEQNFTRHSPPNSPPHGRGTGGNNSPTYGNNGSNDNRLQSCSDCHQEGGCRPCSTSNRTSSSCRSCQDTVNCTGACRTPVYCQSSRPCTSRGYCTSRVHCSNTRPPTSSSYVPKSVHATAAGGHSGTKGVRGRGGSAEKEGKPRSGPHRASTGGASGMERVGGRMLKEQWQVMNTSNSSRTHTTSTSVASNPSAANDESQSKMADTTAVSNKTVCGGEPAEVAKLQAKLRQRENELATQKQENERFLRELQESVECPVCFCVPRAPPVPCCQNGHVICSRCKDKVEVCPTCRIPMTNCVSQVAATIIQRIQHPCDFRDAGCETRCDINSIDEHEERCMFRLVRCPHWACDEMISLTALTSHVIGAECGDNYMTKPLPYQEEIEYTRALDDRDGSSFWRPSLLQFQNITFYLQIEKSGKNGQWYFFVQMEASAAECEQYETKITVCKNTYSDRFSISYHGKVCPIDIKGAEELDQGGCGLSVRDAVMERIFTVDTAIENPVTNVKEAGSSSARGGSAGHSGAMGGEKEEGEVGDHGEEGEGERYKFWVKVDIFNVDE